MHICFVLIYVRLVRIIPLFPLKFIELCSIFLKNPLRTVEDDPPETGFRKVSGCFIFSSLWPFPQCVVRVCCIRSFGHFLTNLHGNVLHFNPEVGIFTSITQSEQDNLVQQAKAQFKMVSRILIYSFYPHCDNIIYSLPSILIRLKRRPVEIAWWGIWPSFDCRSFYLFDLGCSFNRLFS